MNNYGIIVKLFWMGLFFPSHDIALGNGVRHFNPPKAALRLQIDLEELSDMWQREGSAMPIVWGWDYDTRALLHKDYKIKMADLPTDAELETLRTLSSRKTTVSIIERLRHEQDEFKAIEVPTIIDNEESLVAYVETHSRYVLKTPWSSSGRGLSFSHIIPRDTIVKHGAATIRKMGSIMAEPWYDKEQDFAMLFYVGRETVEFIGYSLFDNDDSGTYRCGKLMANERIEASLPSACAIAKKTLRKILGEMFAPLMNKTWEVGYVGIDMMTFRSAGNTELMVHPCVEMNLRCTMGVVARLYFDRNLTTEQTGEFYITPAADYATLAQLDSQLTAEHSSKYRRLTRLTTETMFMAYVIIA